jgi:hypothetical protein
MADMGSLHPTGPSPKQWYSATIEKKLTGSASTWNGDPKAAPCLPLSGRRYRGCRNISELQAQVAAAMGPNQSSQAGSIEPSFHD